MKIFNNPILKKINRITNFKENKNISINYFLSKIGNGEEKKIF